MDAERKEQILKRIEELARGKKQVPWRMLSQEVKQAHNKRRAEREKELRRNKRIAKEQAEAEELRRIAKSRIVILREREVIETPPRVEKRTLMLTDQQKLELIAKGHKALKELGLI